jgi:hypothetical protein
MKVERIEFLGWPNCYRLDNEQIQLVVTTDVGPRIIFCALKDGQNLFKVFEQDAGKTGAAEWHNYGGHRFWHAPEEKPRTYFPDNHPVSLEVHEDFIRLIQPEEPTTRIQKELDLALDEGHPEAMVTHRLRNRGAWSVELAPWGLSVMDGGGVAVLPLPPRGSHRDFLLPSNTLALWPYTDLADARWISGKEFLMLRQDAQAEYPQKIGIHTPRSWGAYVNHGVLFLKQVDYVNGATYPDLNSNFEVFTNSAMLELESLGPLTSLAPGETVEHTERWALLGDTATPGGEADIHTHLLPKIGAVLQRWEA